MGQRRNTKRSKVRTKKKSSRKTSKAKKKKVIQKKKRDLVKTPGLNKNLFSRVKQEYHDLDYSNNLSAKDQVWMSQFMEEYLGAQLDEDTLKNKYKRKAFHKSKKKRKDCFDRNNARQRDIYGLSRAIGTLDNLDAPMIEHMDEAHVDPNYEEMHIEILEAESEQNSILSLKEYEILKDNLTPEAKAFYIKYYKLK